MSRVRLGTRGSLLAMAQAERLKGQLGELHPQLAIEIVPIKTSGDRGQREQLGAFVHEIQLAVLDDRVDIGLHCLKDIPTQQVAGLTFAAYLEREDPRDTIITRGPIWTTLGPGSVIGTGSVRRTSQLAARKDDLQFRPLLGNVDTRLRKLREGEYDAIILAIAGLKRLNLLERWMDSDYRDLRVESLDVDTMMPAPGQAILVLETRESDTATAALVRPLHDHTTELAANAERSFLKAFGGGCSVPVAAWARVEADSIDLQGLVAAPDGSRVLRGQRWASIGDADQVGDQLAAELIAQGAMELFQGAAR